MVDLHLEKTDITAKKYFLNKKAIKEKRTKKSKTALYLFNYKEIIFKGPVQRVLATLLVCSIIEIIYKQFRAYFLIKIVPAFIEYVNLKTKKTFRIEIIHCLVFLIDNLITSIQTAILVNCFSVLFFEYSIRKDDLFGFIPKDSSKELFDAPLSSDSHRYYDRLIIKNPGELYKFLEERVFNRKRELLKNAEFLEVNKAVLLAKKPGQLNSILSRQVDNLGNVYNFLTEPLSLIKSLAAPNQVTLPGISEHVQNVFRERINLRRYNDNLLIKDLAQVNYDLFSKEFIPGTKEHFNSLKDSLPDILTLLLDARLELQNEFFKGVENSKKVGNVTNETLLVINTAINVIKKRVK